MTVLKVMPSSTLDLVAVVFINQQLYIDYFSLVFNGSGSFVIEG
jgi:hypothetical protein